MHKLVLALLLGGGLIAAAGCRSEETASADSASVGDVPRDAAEAPSFPPATHFTLPGADGEEVDLRQFAGKVVLVNFWATWCPPCRFEIPHLVALRKGFDADDVAIIGVSLDRGTLADVRPLLARFIESFGINYPIVHDGEFGLIREYYRGDMRTLGVPMTYIFDRQGRLQNVHTGLPRDPSDRRDAGQVLADELQELVDRR